MASSAFGQVENMSKKGNWFALGHTTGQRKTEEDPEILTSDVFSSTRPSARFSSATQLCPTLGDPMDCSTPGFPVHRQLLELAQTHVYRVSDAIQPSHPLSSPSLLPFFTSGGQSIYLGRK